jgi:hypothetical protein
MVGPWATGPVGSGLYGLAVVLGCAVSLAAQAPTGGAGEGGVPLNTALAQASIVVHLRNLHPVSQGIHCSTAAIEWEGEIVDVLKGDATAGRRLLFWQIDAGNADDIGMTVTGGQPPFAIGGDVVIWPVSSEGCGLHVSPGQVARIEQGVVRWSTTGERGLRGRMPIDEFLTGLRARIRAP